MREDEWLWGWDETPGIVSVWAESDGRALVWRRLPGSLELVEEQARFRPWLLLGSLADLSHLGARLRPEQAASETPAGSLTYREFDGPGALRYLVRGEDGRELTRAVLRGASQRLGRQVTRLSELEREHVLSLAPEEQYLIDSGRTYFRDLRFDELRRLQFDLETTGLDPERHRIFMVALRGPDGTSETLEARSESDEAELIRRLIERIAALDPDVIENHNLHGFDLPFLARRAERLQVPLSLGRALGPRMTLKLDVCWGDRMEIVPRLLDASSCPAGREFVVITSDERVAPCSFHHLSFPIAAAGDVLRVWDEERAALAAPARDPGCARTPGYGLDARRLPLVG